MTGQLGNEGFPVCVLDDVSAAYSAADAEPLVGVTLSVDRGEVLAILGPNGAGKSTLLRVMGGALETRRGSVRLFGEPLGDRARVATRVAFVPQSSEVAFGYRVREVVMMGRAPHQGSWMRPSEADEAAVDEALRRCDLEHLTTRRADELSGGEQKRVSIARALAQAPELLLLDEPGAFLDVKHQLLLHDLLEQLRKDGMACVVVMHDLTLAAQYASRICLMKGGRIVAAGTIEEVMTYARLKETFDADLYCGVNDLTGARFFLPMKGRTV